MMADFSQVLTEVAQFTVEDWGMMIAEPADEIALTQGEDCYLAEMDFEGDDGFRGRISILCQGGFAAALTRNLLGMDAGEEVTVEQSLDALREMANVITGHFVTEAFGEDERFALLSPGSRAITYSEALTLAAENCVGLVGDDELVILKHVVPLTKE
jgi:hypothetical protein